MRLDRALAARGIARSRSHAQGLIAAGRVRVAGTTEVRSSREVADSDTISLDAPDPYVSRGAWKLNGAIDGFAPKGLVVSGCRCLDAGASTGGFTQVLLERGATRVLAIDVGHGQLAPTIADDPRVESREGVNLRDLDPPGDDEAVDLIVADLSFISLTLVINRLGAWLRPGGDALVLVKPQFEVGAARVRATRGVVRDEAARGEAVGAVAHAAQEAGLGVIEVQRSPVSGADGNVEIFIWARKAWQAGDVVAPPGAPQPLDATSLQRAIAREVTGTT